MPPTTPRAAAFAPATMANLGVGFDILGLAVAEPGGAMRDQEVIAAADEAGIAMVFTGVRHFRH